MGTADDAPAPPTSAPTAAHQHAMTQPMVDDFGLPIKRFPTPTPEDADTNKPDAETAPAPAAQEAQSKLKPKEPPAPPATREASAEEQPQHAASNGDVKPTPTPAKATDTDSENDEADFKDAQTAIEPEAAPAAAQKQDAVKRPDAADEKEGATNSSEATIKPEMGQTTTGATAPVAPSQTSEQVEEEGPVILTDAADKPRPERQSIDSRADGKNEKKHRTRASTGAASHGRMSQDLGAAASSANAKTGHHRDTSVASNGIVVSEFSHQQLSVQPENHKEDEDEGWQEMPSFAPYDMYNDDNKLIAREMKEDDVEADGYAGLGGAGKGYTRVVMDEDAESATSMDEHTQYLFKDANAGGTSMNDEDARDAVSQMQATKDLLTEGQRIAYVGLVRLEIAKLVVEAEKVEATRKLKKMVNMSTEATKMWGQKMMIRLYAHMDISEAEQVMIEQLAEHGVQPGDLTPTLLANSRVKNPMADSKRSSVMSSTPSDERPAEAPPPYEATESDHVPDVQTPSQMPHTEKIDIDLRWTVLCDMFLVLIADSIYDARSRILLERVAQSLDISWIDICRFEKRVTDALEMQQAAEKENWNEEEHMEERRKQALKRRYMMMGLATVGGGLVIGLSAGLLAPVIGAGLAAGFTTIGVSGTGSFLAGAGGAAIITSSAAASGSFIGGRAAGRRTGAVKTFEYRPLHNNKRVNLIVTVSGWLTGKMDDVRLPYSTVDPVMGDLYSVLWEPEMLRSMGDTINILATEALTQGLQQLLGSTILMSLMAALQLPLVLTKLSYLIDNPWAVSLDRATSAGLILADSIIERGLGTRPITLVGYSLGSRVIYSCLQELAKKGAYGLVQNVYIFGSPVVVKKEEYIKARTVVAGRFVNGYNRNDWILGYLFRLTNGGIRKVAGLGPIEDCPWIENMDVTELVAGHMEYRTAMPVLLMKCGWTVTSEEFSEIEDPDPENHGERQRELINEIEEARKELEKEEKANNGKSRFSLFGRKKKADREEWEVYEESNAAADGAKNGNGGATKASSNSGVLFDIDAIRAELAKEENYREPDPEVLQIKEIQSTLPPMKLDIAAPTTAPSSGPTSARSTVSQLQGANARRETQSAEALPIRPSALGAEGHAVTRKASWNNGVVDTAAYHAEADYGADEGEISMTFDTSFHDDGGVSMADEALTRPGLTTAKTLPVMALADPWSEEAGSQRQHQHQHQYDDLDDEDFGQEKEISMTFA
ncbi:DUF726 domain protein [Cordyceps fumosorosea ARSEF 2679]|uniref:DUF726 domain protein n=1 Tax=Cordyceps fumosorosea (strain ARSEF 2679) TaxID=1081104 RepID=A0A162JSJ1_CORFA|nr:DUF726 domain protein [Cordyceps fumosorosea ARSEF 2679]OAA73112.1 DUF726 domain protein [Cordyceps fumosorosea ARSEF 2679]